MKSPVRAFIYKEVREGRWKYVIVALVFVVLGAVTPALYDVMLNVVGQMLVDPSMPESLRRLLSPDMLELTTYLWANWHGKTLYQIMVLSALIFGATAVAGEFSRGSAPFLFSRAVSRRTVVFVKTAVDLVALTLAAVFGTAALDASARIFHDYAAPWTYYGALVPMMAGAAFIYGLSLLMSSRFDDPIKAGAAAAIVAALLSVPTLVPAWRRWSVYVHMTGASYLGGGPFPWSAVLVIAGLAAGLVAAANESVKRKDM